jgi:plastocyanin
MKKEGVIGIVIALIVIVVLLGFGLFSNLSTDTNPELPLEEDSETGEESNQETEEEIVVETPLVVEKFVEITSSGSFVPETLTISQGDRVTWTNEGSRSVWPASNNHPTHKLYLGFDSLKGLKLGGSYSFTFNEVGTWKYHDHLRSSVRGTVIVN